MAQNINLPAALLSRFDLIFLLLDRADPQHDAQLADHITHVHRTSSHPPLGFDPLPQPLIRACVLVAWLPASLPCLSLLLRAYGVELRRAARDVFRRARMYLSLVSSSSPLFPTPSPPLPSPTVTTFRANHSHN